MVWSVKHFRIYLHGEKFTIVTDHAALYWLMNLKEANNRLARWSMYIQTFRFEIVHRKGKNHANVDCLSRPVTETAMLSVDENNENNSSEKNLDPYEDGTLLHYLIHKKHKQGTSTKVVKRVLRDAGKYKYDGNVIYFIKDKIELKIPEKESRADIITIAHSLGHFQAQSTYDRLRENYFWKNMLQDVKKVIAKCAVCIRHQPRAPIIHPAIAIEVNGIFERVGIDLVFGLPETAEGYTGILVITEYLTKYPYAVPIKTKTAEEIARKLFIYISIFGPPKILLSDQGKEFLNQIINNLANVCGTERRVTSPYKPSTNGLTERFNETLIVSLKKHCEEDPKSWDKWIPYVLMAYRTRVHSVTNITPFQLMFGRPMNKFEDFVTERQNTSIEQRAEEIQFQIEEMQPKAINVIKTNQVKQKKTQDKTQNSSSNPNRH